MQDIFYAILSLLAIGSAGLVYSILKGGKNNKQDAIKKAVEKGKQILKKFKDKIKYYSPFIFIFCLCTFAYPDNITNWSREELEQKYIELFHDYTNLIAQCEDTLETIETNLDYNQDWSITVGGALYTSPQLLLQIQYRNFGVYTAFSSSSYIGFTYRLHIGK